MDAGKTGAFICALRKEKGYTQAALAEKLNISNRTVSKWENGDGFPDITIMPDIAKLLEVSVDELLAGKRKPDNVADIKVTEIENKDNLNNIFQITFIISLFFTIFGSILCTVTEIYSIWAFRILFYTHWEIIFVAVAFFAIIAGGLVFSVGTTRLAVSYKKREIIKKAGKKGWLICLISSAVPASFLIRIISCSPLRAYTLPAAAIILLILTIIFIIAYKKLKTTS